MADSKNDGAKLNRIANLCKTSISTVSRAINHCGGIDSEVRSKILSENERISDKT